MGKGGNGEKVTAEGKLAGDRIKHAMKIAPNGPYTQASLARLTGIGSSTLGQYIQGKRKLQIWVAKRLQDKIRIPAAYLMGLIDETDMELLMAPAPVRKAWLEVLRSMAPKPTGVTASIPSEDGPFVTGVTDGARRRARR